MLRAALRELRREIASGELRLLLAALVVGVASLASVLFYVDRFEQALDQRRAEWLGGDLVLASTRAIPAAWIARAEAEGLRQSETLSFRSMVVSGAQMALGEVKGVTSGYPLKGQVRLATGGEDAGVPATGIPGKPEAWVAPLLLQKLGIEVGDPIQLGRLELRVSGVIEQEPDQGADLFTLAPRVLVNRAVIAESGLIQPGSRVKYRLSLAGEAAALERYRQWLEGRLTAADRLQGEMDERSRPGRALERAGRFLKLASMIGFVLAAVALGMAAHRYALRHQGSSAIYRCLGASGRQILGFYAFQLLLLALVGSLVGAGLGYLAHLVLEQLFGPLVTMGLPPPSPRPLGTSLLAGLVITAGCGFASLYQLHRVPPLRVLRRDAPLPPISRRLLYLPPFLVVAILMWVQAGDPALAAAVLGGVAVTLGFLVLGALGAIRVVRGFRPSGVVTRFAVNGLTRRTGTSLLQTASVGIGLMVILLVSLVSRDLLQGWNDDIPEDAPNHFVINMQAHQRAGVQAFFRESGLAPPAIYPMVRGRLIRINDREVSAANYTESRAQQLIRREFNLSWAAQLRGDNPVVAGQPWDSSSVPRWSVEQGAAEQLGIKPGDRLTFDVAGTSVAGEVANLRKVRWDTFQVNFYVIASPGLLDANQASYITAIYLPKGAEARLPELISRYPNLTDINVEALLVAVRTVISQVTLSVEFISLFTLAAGFLVLFAAVQTSMDERLRESTILRLLGASRQEIRLALVLEFALLGLIAGLLASFGAWLVGYLVTETVLPLSWGIDPILWLAGPVAGVTGMLVAGLWATREVVNRPPLSLVSRAE